MEIRKEKENFSLKYATTSGVISSTNQKLYHATSIHFRIAVLPTKENLNAATQALKSIFIENNLNFHILSLNGDKTYDELGWDGTNAQLDQPSNEDRRGGEVIFEISYSEVNQDYDLSPANLKSLLLQIWQKLKQEGVIVGHLCPNSDSLAVETKDGLLTPFSYTKLSSDENDDQDTHDPLEHEKISRKDLKKHGISIVELEFEQAARIEYTERHLARAKQALQQEILKLKTKSEELFEILCRLNPKCPEKNSELPLFLQKHQDDLEKIKWATPHLFNKKDQQISISPDLRDFISSWQALANNRDIEQNASKFIKSLKQLTQQSNRVNGNFVQTFERIEQNYLSNSYINNMMENNNCNVKEMVEQHPVRMQLLHRKLTHLENEEKNLDNYKNKLAKKHNRQINNKDFYIIGCFILGVVLTGVGLFLLATGVGSLLGAAMMLGGAGLMGGTLLYAGCGHLCKKPHVEKANPFLEAEQSERDSSYSGPLRQVAGRRVENTVRDNNSQATQKVTPSTAETKKKHGTAHKTSPVEEEGLDFDSRSSVSSFN